MDWTRKDKHYLESADGRYTIAKYMTDETPRYGLWLRPDPKTSVLIAFYDSEDEAKQKAGEVRNG
jgi:hypothetical protein